MDEDCHGNQRGISVGFVLSKSCAFVSNHRNSRKPWHILIMQTSSKYYILIPAYNRRDVTLQCLRQLQSLIATHDWRVCIIDDGSTDGTSEAIRQNFPEVVLLHGNGNLYWTGAMELGMRYAVACGAECCVWMNDDLQTDTNSIYAIVALAMSRHAVVAAEGVVQDANRPPYFYPGFYRRINRLESRSLDIDASEPISVDCCRGNLAAIPCSVIDKIGYPNGTDIPHYAGDAEYTLRATEAVTPCLILMQAVFFEQETVRNDNRSWLLDKRPVSKIWAATLSRRGMLYPPMLRGYYIGHWGFFGLMTIISILLRLIAISILRMIIPRKILHFLYARHSHSYKAYQGRPETTGTN